MATVKNNIKNVVTILLTFTICRIIVSEGLTVDQTLTEILHIGLEGEVSTEAAELEAASLDFGRLSSKGETIAVVRPASANDVARVVKAAYKWQKFAVSARGHGHSINGQADTGMKGVVIEMGKGGVGIKGPLIWEKEMYVDVWGGELWIHVLKSTLEYGLAPMSWTDYLYLSVGGTLSNGGISGQTFNHGPQISNVFELDVVTGT